MNMRLNRQKRPDSRAIKGTASATVRAGWAVCQFSSGRCECFEKNRYPCDSVRLTANVIIQACKEQLAEKYVLRRRPQKKSE